ILLDRVERHSGPPRNLVEKQLLSQSHTWMMFKSPMCITPMSTAAHGAAGRVTWVNSQWKLGRYPGHCWVEINTNV
ncbi:unnamed protein product, partial [Chrysoparadoxa australica]